MSQLAKKKQSQRGNYQLQPPQSKTSHTNYFPHHHRNFNSLDIQVECFPAQSRSIDQQIPSISNNQLSISQTQFEKQYLQNSCNIDNAINNNSNGTVVFDMNSNYSLEEEPSKIEVKSSKNNSQNNIRYIDQLNLTQDDEQIPVLKEIKINNNEHYYVQKNSSKSQRYYKQDKDIAIQNQQIVNQQNANRQSAQQNKNIMILLDSKKQSLAYQNQIQKINTMNQSQEQNPYYSIQKENLQEFIYAEVRRILQNQVPKMRESTEFRRSFDPSNHNGFGSPIHFFNEEVKINPINICPNPSFTSNFTIQPTIQHKQTLPQTTNNHQDYDTQLETISIDENHFQQLSHKRHQSHLPAVFHQERPAEDLKITVHENILEQSFNQWKKSKLNTQRQIKYQKLTPGKIIDFDRNWTKYTKKELQSYVEILQQDLLNVRRQVGQSQPHDQFQRHEIEQQIHEMIRNHEQSINLKNQIIINKEFALKSVLEHSEMLINIQSENHLSFLEFYKQIIQLEQRLKSSYQTGERNAAFKIEQLIKEKVNIFLKFDQNQDQTIKIQNNIQSILNDLKISEQTNSALEVREESLEEFDTEINMKKEMHIKQLTTKNQKKIYDFQSEKIGVQSKQIQTDNNDLKTFDQQRAELKDFYEILLQKANYKFINEKSKNKNLKKQLQNQEKILENMKKADNINKLITESFERADTLFQDQENINPNMVTNYSDKPLPIIDKVKDMKNLSNQDKELIIDSLIKQHKKSQIYNNYSKQQDKKRLQILMEIANNCQAALNVYLNLSQHQINKSPFFVQIGNLLRSIQGSLDKLNISNQAQQILESTTIDQLNLIQDVIVAKKNNDLLDLDISDFDEKQLKSFVFQLRQEIKDLQEQLLDIKVDNEILTQMNGAGGSNENFKNSRSEISNVFPNNFSSSINSSKLTSHQRLMFNTIKFARDDSKGKKKINKNQNTLNGSKEFFTVFGESQPRKRKNSNQISNVEDLLQFNYTMASSIENLLIKK